jgi:hypothetical protein
MFSKGVGVGIIAGSAIGMTVAIARKRNGRQSKVSKALKTIGEIAENIGGAFSM